MPVCVCECDLREDEFDFYNEFGLRQIRARFRISGFQGISHWHSHHYDHDDDDGLESSIKCQIKRAKG